MLFVAKIRAIFFASAAACFFAALSIAYAGDFNETDGVAIKAYDPVAYFTQNKAVKGSPQFTSEYHGSKFEFVSADDRDLFAKDPAKYAPRYDGFCAFAAAEGEKAKSDPEAFRIVDGKLYLNYNKDVATKWSIDSAGYIKKADANWPTVEKLQPAD